MLGAEVLAAHQKVIMTEAVVAAVKVSVRMVAIAAGKAVLTEVKEVVVLTIVKPPDSK